MRKINMGMDRGFAAFAKTGQWTDLPREREIGNVGE